MKDNSSRGQTSLVMNYTKQTITMRKALFYSCFHILSLLPLTVSAQDSTSQIRSEVLEMDSLLFQVAFNHCEIDLFREIVAKDLEFYDDRSGLNTSLEKEVASLEDKCSKPFAVTRKLLETEIHGLGDFGAVQSGTHQFLVDGRAVEIARFTTIWEKSESKWIMKRAISYDHQSID